MIYWCVKNCILEEDNIPESAFCLAVKIQFLFSVSVIQLSRSENLQTTLESDWIRRMSQNDAVAIRELPTVLSKWLARTIQKTTKENCGYENLSK
jgi:hypothetical protein